MLLENRLLISYDVFDYDRDLVSEAIEKKLGPIVLRGILQKADTLNQNGRVYPTAILEREVRNYQKKIAERTSTGELDHPNDSTVNLKNVSHVITETHWDGQTVMGSAEILDTPSGMTLQALVKGKIKLGISSRGVGSVEKRGDYFVVQDDFQIICWDFVSEPSTTSAYMLPEGLVIGEDSKYARRFRVQNALDTVLAMKVRK